MRYIILLLVCVCQNLIITQAQNAIWERHTIDSSFSGADGVRLADVNGDKLLDITTGWEEAGFTKVYVHPSYESVKERWPMVIVGKTPSVEDAVFVDLDQDGAIDVISCTEGKSKKVFLHWAPQNPNDYLDSSKWITEILPASDGLMQWMFALPLQIDSKNGMDFVIGSKGKNAQIGWFQSPKNPRKLSKWKWFPISKATWVMSLFSRDMDYDGDMDIIISDRKPGATNGVRWLENPENQKAQKKAWSNHFIGAKGLEVMFMDMADLDGDGLEDAIVTEYTNQRIRFFKRLDQSGLKWQEYQINLPKLAGRAKAVKVGDIDQDGYLDIVHSANTLKKEGKSGIIWLSSNGNPTKSDWNWNPISGPIGYKFDRIELLDLDGDGDLDILTCEENYGSNSQGLGVIWYENPLVNK